MNRRNLLAYTNWCLAYQALNRWFVCLVWLFSRQGQDLLGFFRLLQALCHGLLRGFLGLRDAVFLPQQSRKVEVGLAVGGERRGLAIRVDRRLDLVGEVIGLRQRQVGLEVGLEDALGEAVVDDGGYVLLAAVHAQVGRVQDLVVAVFGQLARGAHLLERGGRLVEPVGLRVHRGQVHLLLLVGRILGGELLGQADGVVGLAGLGVARHQQREPVVLGL